MAHALLAKGVKGGDGVAILATNLRANIDEAFTRRLDCIVDFPTPTEELRLQLWRHCLAPPLPLGDDLDLEFCAAAFELTGAVSVEATEAVLPIVFGVS